MTKISVFLPAYKTEFLAEAIQSILNQTFRDFELLIVNDASPYGVNDVVSSFIDNRIKYEESKENQGMLNLVGFWNEKIKQCKGEFLLIASDDDIYSPTYLQEMLFLADKYPTTDLFHCRIGFIDSKGDLVQIAQPALSFETQMDFIYQRLIWKRKQTLQEFLFRTSVLIDKGGIVSFPLAWSSDSATAYMMAEHGVAYSSSVLFFLRMSGKNISTPSNYTKQKIEAMKLSTQWIQSFLPNVKCETPEDEFMKKEAIRISYAEKYVSYPRYLQRLSLADFIKEIKYIAQHRIFSWRAIIYFTFKKLFHL